MPTRRRGFSLIELLIVIAIILIIAAVAIPNIVDARRASLEMASVRALTTINTAQVQYFSTYGRYAQSLIELGPPVGDTASSPAASGLIPEDLATGIKSGYVFTMVGTPGGYTVNADPQTFDITGARTFYTDHTNIVRNRFANEPATENDPPIQ